jgi:hypothetical protein
MTDRSLKSLLSDTLRKARLQVADQGPSELSVPLIVDCLRELGQAPGLKEAVPLRPLHRGTAAGNVLASEGRDGITLFLARLNPEAPTPIHDHGTWGVAYVFDGRDRYLQWSMPGMADDPGRTPLHLRYERILAPGDSEWFVPPDDIHSQQGEGGYAWELILFGRDITQFPRRYFDPDTGRVTIIHSD